MSTTASLKIAPIIQASEGHIYRVKLAYKEGSNCPPLHNYEGVAYCQNVSSQGYVCLLIFVEYPDGKVRGSITTWKKDVLVEDLGKALPFLVDDRLKMYGHHKAYSEKEKV